MCSTQKTPLANNNSIDIVGYTYPQLYTGKEWYIGFMAYDPALGKSRRKRYKINFIDSVTKRRRYASQLITRLTIKLEQGWNPWIEAESGNSYHYFSDVCTNYIIFLTKMYNEDQLREKTFTDYNYRLQAVIKWNLTRKVPITYIYQFDRQFIQEFLDYIFLEENNSPRTRNNYLNWIKSFCAFLVSKMYFKTRPTEGIAALRVPKKTDRIVIAENDLFRLNEYLERTNKHFMLACYVQHYALIRPKEMSHIRISDISLKNQTIFVSGQFSKNREDAIVTLPAKVAKLMIELDVFKSPGKYYLFGKDFKPSATRRDEKQFREYWSKTVRKELNFTEKYKFYSLKDTGITNMLRTCDVITVRDQARHSSILMTNLYTPQDIQEANDLLKNYNGVF